MEDIRDCKGLAFLLTDREILRRDLRVDQGSRICALDHKERPVRRESPGTRGPVAHKEYQGFSGPPG